MFNVSLELIKEYHQKSKYISETLRLLGRDNLIDYSGLEKNDRYKSSVFIDTFLTRFGDLSGSIYIGIGKLYGIGIGLMPILSIPIAGVLSIVGIKIFNKGKYGK